MSANQRISTLPYHFGGTLAANQVINFKLPYPCTIVSVLAGANNNSSATLAMSGSATISATAIGDSASFVEITTAKIALTESEAVVLTLDFDGAAGTAAQDVDILVTILAGG